MGHGWRRVGWLGTLLLVSLRRTRRRRRDGDIVMAEREVAGKRCGDGLRLGKRRPARGVITPIGIGRDPGDNRVETTTDADPHHGSENTTGAIGTGPTLG